MEYEALINRILEAEQTASTREKTKMNRQRALVNQGVFGSRRT